MGISFEFHQTYIFEVFAHSIYKVTDKHQFSEFQRFVKQDPQPLLIWIQVVPDIRVKV